MDSAAIFPKVLELMIVLLTAPAKTTSHHLLKWSNVFIKIIKVLINNLLSFQNYVHSIVTQIQKLSSLNHTMIF